MFVVGRCISITVVRLWYVSVWYVQYMFMIGSMVRECIRAVHVYDRVYGTSVYRSSTCL